MAALLAFLPAPARAADCEEGWCDFSSCATPAYGAPAALWGELVPVDTGQLPADRDNTDFDDSIRGDRHGPSEPLWTGLDITDGWLFATVRFSVQVWSLAPDPADPELRTSIGPSSFPHFPADPHETNPINVVAVAPGDPDIITVGLAGTGLAVFDVFDDSGNLSPRWVYADADPIEILSLHIGQIGGTPYAFAGTKGAGVRVYDLEKALGSGSSCSDTSDTRTCGVHVTDITNRSFVSDIRGAGNSDGTAHWISVSNEGSPGVDLLDVSNPASPRFVGEVLPDEYLMGSDLWRDGNRYLLGTRLSRSLEHSEAQIHDVSCVTSGSCGSSPELLWNQSLFSTDRNNAYVRHSQSGGRHFLHHGAFNSCPRGGQNEWLFEVTEPENSHDLTPPPAMINGEEVHYWGWYYRYNGTGFNKVGGLTGMVEGEYFYRAAHGMFDIHKLAGGVPPVADFSWQGETDGNVYVDTEVQFTDESSGVPDAWSWTFPDATPLTSTVQNPFPVVFGTQGSKAVELIATNDAGSSDPAQKTVSVLAPEPSAGSVVASPDPALQCETVLFTPQDVQGKPPLEYGWSVTDPDGVIHQQASTEEELSWPTDAQTAPGTYTAEVTITNSYGSTDSQGTVLVEELPTLAFLEQPSHDPFTNNVVQFHVDTQGATEWSWDFGDGTTTGWLTDREAGQHPSHTYSQSSVDLICNGTLPCTFEVTVDIRNCAAGPLPSDTLLVTIDSLEPLVASFEAQGICGFGPCSAETGETITFQDLTQGDPDTYEYAWGDGIVESASQPITSHTYNQSGSYAPVLTVHRGSETDQDTHETIHVSDPQVVNPSIQVSGPSSGTTGEDLTFQASASDCSPSASGWNWGVDGGSIQTNNGSSVTVRWATGGSKTVSASNSACGSATGFASVSISDDDGSGDDGSGDDGSGDDGSGDDGSGSGPTASFSFTPSAPVVGEPVTFDASDSTGQIDSYSWEIDGTVAGSGQTSSHTFSETGSYSVELTVSGPGDDCKWQIGGGDGGGVCTDTQTETVDVGPGEVEVVIHDLVVPWISQSDLEQGLPQSSDLVIHNPGDEMLTAKVTFRKRGRPEPDPPAGELTIAPQGTQRVPNIVEDLFDRPNLSGFLLVEVLNGDAEPVVSSVNRTFQEDGRIFGQVVPGLPVEQQSALTEGGPEALHLVGLNANTDRLAYFGITNPSEQPLSYHLRFYDSRGQFIGGTDEPEGIARFGQKQYQPEELRDRFGIEGLDDYRVEIDPGDEGPRPYVYGANVRMASKDPSFLRPGRVDADEVYLLGVLNTPGLNDSVFRSDLVLGNSSEEPTTVEATFTSVGVRSEPTAPLSTTIPPGETLRSENVVENWDVSNVVGVLRVVSSNPQGIYPVVQGESYDSSRRGELYGQFMPALTEEDAAVPDDPHVLAGLRQDEERRTTLWLFNPTDQVATYSIRYVNPVGILLGLESDLRLGTGKIRQINPGHHPFVDPSDPIGGPGDFVVVVEVTAGKLLTAAQVVNQANDPAYIVGQ